MADGLSPDEVFELKSALQMLVAEMRDAANGTKDFARATGQRLAQEEEDIKLSRAKAAEEKRTSAAQKKVQSQLSEMEKSLKDFSVKQKLMTSMFGQQAGVYSAAFDGMVVRLKAVGKALGDGLKIITDGITAARASGLSAQAGAAAAIGSQLESIRSIFTFDPNTMFSPEEISKSVGDVNAALNGFSNGLAPSVESLTQFRTSLSGVGIIGQPTAETFQALAFVGATTTQEFNSLRAATGRQTISTSTLAGAINKNLTSVNVFGNSILKRALDFDRLGITLDSLTKGQESYVTSLDQQIDAVAQLGQLGTAIDFEKLTMLQEFGEPGQAQEYISSLINAEDLRSSSYRALLGQISGIDVQEILKIKGAGNFEKLENQVATNAKAQEDANNKLATLAQILKTLTENSFVKFSVSLLTSAASLVAFTVTALAQIRLLKTLGNVPPGTPGAPTAGGPTTTGGGAKPTTGGMVKGGAGTGAAVGVGAGIATASSTIMAGGSWKKALLMGVAPILGGVLGGVLGGAISAIPILVPFAPVIIPLFSGLGSTLASAVATKFADDMISMPGYGERTLVTPSGNIALNNNDTVMAGTNLFNKGTLQAGSSNDSAPLLAKIDRLVSTIENASTTISVGGETQKVPRFQLVGVRSRNEVE